MTGVRVKGWHKFQHFKDRKPPWVKLYRDLLDDLEWHILDPFAAKNLVMLWLIASEDDGNLPEVKKLAFRLRISEQECKSLICKLSHWLERDDIELISCRHQGDAPETETETETEKKRPPSGAGAPDCPHLEIVEAYNRILPELPGVRFSLWNGTRSKHLAARWKEDPDRQSLEWWEDFFGFVKTCPLLMGRAGTTGWKADLGWLVNPANIVKVIEGKYSP